jgi:hypothetical protein
MAGLASYALRMPIWAHCGEDNPARARFCLACGAPLAGSGTGREVRKTVTVVFSGFAVPSVGIFRITDGRITEHWGVFDQLAMLGQLGAFGG